MRKLLSIIISMRKVITILLALPFFSLVSCQQQPSTQQATAELCGNLAQLDRAIGKASNLTPASTVGEFRTIKRQIDNAMERVNKSARQVEKARLNNLNNANENFNRTVQRISNRDTLASAASSIRQASTKVQAAETELSANVNCQ